MNEKMCTRKKANILQFGSVKAKTKRVLPVNNCFFFQTSEVKDWKIIDSFVVGCLLLNFRDTSVSIIKHFIDMLEKVINRFDFTM